MHITPSDIRNAVMDPAYRISTHSKGGGPTATASLLKAIREYHNSGPEAAWTVPDLVDSDHSGQ